VINYQFKKLISRFALGYGCIPIGIFLREKSFRNFEKKEKFPSTDPIGEFLQSMFLQRSDPIEHM